MEYKISIANNKTQEFLQIIQSLQKLGVVLELDTLKNAKQSKKENTLSIKRGSGKEVISYIADDFDAPLDDFKDYM